MGLWKLMKETYKGSKYVLSEVNKGIVSVNNELEAYNAKQALIEPLRDARHLCRMNLHQLKMISIVAPDDFVETKKLITNTEMFFHLLSQLMQYGIDDRNGCRETCLAMANHMLKDDRLDTGLYCEFLKGYSLTQLNERGYTSTNGSDDFLDRIEFVFSYDKINFERRAKITNSEIKNTYIVTLEEFVVEMNNTFKLGLSVEHYN